MKKTGVIFSLGWLSVFIFSCAASMNEASVAHQNSIEIRSVCERTGLNGCSVLGSGYEKFALREYTAAKAHILVMLSQNPKRNIRPLVKAIELSAPKSGAGTTTISQYNAFIQQVAEQTEFPSAEVAKVPNNSPDKGPTTADQSETMPIPEQCPETQCSFDVQCKSDRVCIAGECVSPQYAAAVEALYMKPREIATGQRDPSTGADTEKIQLLVPPVETDTVICSPQKVSSCMKRCELGNKESCYSVAKVYENLPPAARRSEYILYAYHKACTAGLSNACIHLGRLYYEGTLVARELFKCFHNNVEACKLGNSLGCANAAELQENGIGVTKDSNAADKYFAMACTLGHDDSCNRVRNDQPIHLRP